MLSPKSSLAVLIFCLFKLGSAAIAEGGGWLTDKQSAVVSPGPCNIEVRETISQEEFIEQFAYTAPLILRMPSRQNKLFREACEKQTMVEKFGDKVIRLSSANTHSYKKVDVTLQDYVQNILRPQSLDTLGSETLYWFGDNNYTEWKELFDLYQQPPFSLPSKEGLYSFGLAGSGTGVPFHWHGPGFGEVIYGQKRWFLYPPDNTPHFHPDETTLHWLINDYPELHPDDMPLECTLNEGEVIYFPDRWWHATLNIGTSVFISTFLG